MGAVYVETSARDGEGVFDMFTGVAMRVPMLEGLDQCLEEDIM
jgi:hypothetical protein